MEVAIIMSLIVMKFYYTGFDYIFDKFNLRELEDMEMRLKLS